ncbi:MAG TPA: signal peptidase II [Candidatus Latescibacteria bacterium]|nr:signal peptidase II [Candidatus Latescibacterota bacterium]HJP29849.1 signal peptidase II [Candidatus Latescibacterota bacterium]
MISLRGIELWCVPVALVLDQVSKAVVVNTMRLHSPVPLLGDAVRLTYIQNAGAAFGLKLGGPLLHTLVAIGALGVLGWLFLSLPATARLQRTALAMVLGGALGNIIDRIRFDYVIDFFDVGVSEAWRWPVFNVADSFVTVGVLVLALSWSRQKAPDAPPAAAEETAAGSECAIEE